MDVSGGRWGVIVSVTIRYELHNNDKGEPIGYRRRGSIVLCIKGWNEGWVDWCEVEL